MPVIETPEWELVCDFGALVSECPMWSAQDRVLYWVNIYASSFNRTNPETGETTTWRVPSRIGSYGLRPGGALLALQTGLFELDFGSGALTKRYDPPYDSSKFYFNDGRCDAKGRFWVGSCPAPNTDGKGDFYRVDASGFDAQIHGLSIANGIAFSPDQKTLYTSETWQGLIFAYDYDLEAGVASNQRLFKQMEAGENPDGAATDSEGGYWSAMITSGRIVRFTPDGTIDRIIQTPTRYPSMIAFGGDNLSTSFITSSRKYYEGLSEEERAREPHAGGLWKCELTGVKGIAEPKLSF